VRSALRRSDALILSSVSEAFPNVLVEAMAEGVPCISTDVGDAKEIIGETGWVVPPANPCALAAAIKSAAQAAGGSQWAARRCAAFVRVRTRYSMEATLEKYQ